MPRVAVEGAFQLVENPSDFRHETSPFSVRLVLGMNLRMGAGRVPLARALSKLGLASRAEAIRLIQAGRVTVSGRVVSDPGHPVNPERTAIAIDGGGAVTRAARVVILLHKPRGVVTTRSDPEGRPTAYELIRDLTAGEGTHLAPVGRL